MSRLGSIRVRLTLLGAAVTSVVVLGYAALAVALLERGYLETLDARLVADAEHLERSLHWDGERARLVGAVEARPGAGDEDPVWSEIVDPSGEQLLWRSPSLGARRLPGWGGGELRRRLFREVELAGGVEVRMLVLPEPVDGVPVVLKLARATEPHQRELAVVASRLWLATPAALVLALLGGWFLSGRVLRPVERMRETAERLSAERLDERIPQPSTDDELGRLASTLNGMLARLERSFETLRQFTSDASHELRTPLAAMRAEVEVVLQQARGAAEYRAALESVLEEIDRMAQLVDQLLALSRDERGGTLAPVDLAAVARDLVAELGILAEEREQQLALAIAGDCRAVGEVGLVRRVLTNLIHNAIRYTPEGGRIRVSVRPATGGGVEASVEDDGPGIAPEHRSKVFDRFYRVDRSRSRELGGAGLGLAIARGAAERLGGRLGLEESALGGARFVLWLRAVEESA